MNCYVCGCSQHDACLVYGLPCCWVSLRAGESPLCSACAPLEELLATPLGRRWLKYVLVESERGGVVRFSPSQAMLRAMRELGESRPSVPSYTLQPGEFLFGNDPRSDGV